MQGVEAGAERGEEQVRVPARVEIAVDELEQNRRVLVPRSVAPRAVPGAGRRSLIPLGTVERVAGTALDLRRPGRLGPRIRDPRLAATRGYDAFWVLDKRGDRTRPQVAARAYDPASGRTLEALTTEPGVVIYTANGFPPGLEGIGGPYRDYAAFTLETQRYPDSPNQPQFPSTELRPGQEYESTTVFRFGLRE